MTFRTTRVAVVAAIAAVLYVFDPATSSRLPVLPAARLDRLAVSGAAERCARCTRCCTDRIGAAMHDNALATLAVFAMGIAWLRDRVRPTPAPWLGALTRAGFSARRRRARDRLRRAAEHSDDAVFLVHTVEG